MSPEDILVGIRTTNAKARELSELSGLKNLGGIPRAVAINSNDSQVFSPSRNVSNRFQADGKSVITA